MTKTIMFGAAAALLMVTAPVAEAQATLRANQIADVQGIQTACGGASLDDQERMSGLGYPVTLKLVGGYGQWLGNGDVTISGDNGAQAISLRCEGPWVSMQLPPGRYTATVGVSGAPLKTVSFTVGRGQREVLVRFPERRDGRGQNYQDWNRRSTEQQPGTM
jgi:hypothetical protein